MGLLAARQDPSGEPMRMLLLLIENVGYRLSEWATKGTSEPYGFLQTLRLWNPKVPS